ncbi:MAG: hypothetical protein IKE24_04295 [Clostridia bacterium]|nr:hypothetical protein [Clostridia bacterium]
MEGINKKTHAGLGLALGVIALLLGGGASILFGVYGAAAAVILGVIAVLLGIGARKAGKGIGAIVTGVLAVIVAIAVAGMTVAMLRLIHETAMEMDDAPLIAEYMDKPEAGMMGFVMGIPAGSDMADFSAEMERVRQRMEQENSAISVP